MLTAGLHGLVLQLPVFLKFDCLCLFIVVEVFGAGVGLLLIFNVVFVRCFLDDFWGVPFLLVVLSSLPTSETLLQCCSSSSLYLYLIPVSLPTATSKMHSALWPCCQRSTVGRLPSKRRHCTVHCFQVTLLVFSDACSDSTYIQDTSNYSLPLMTMLASSHLQLFPPLMAMLASSQSQSEWALLPPEQTTTTSLHQSSYADSLTLKAFTRSASDKE